MVRTAIKSALYFCLAVLTAGFVAEAQVPVPVDLATPPGGIPALQLGNDRVSLDAPEAAQSMRKLMAPVIVPTFPAQRPTIDGVITPGEWTGAVELVGLNRGVPQTSPLGDKVWMFVDACYLYVGAAISSPTNYAGYNLDGNATCINMWFDLDEDGQWDVASPNTDGIISLPAPGNWYPDNVAAVGYRGLPGGWTTSPTGGLIRMVPWGASYNNVGMGVVLPPEEVFVQRVHPAAGYHTVEARIDITNSPLKMLNGNAVNMRIHWYSGYYTTVPYDGVQLIQGEWPDYAIDYYYGCYPYELRAQTTPTFVPPAPDPYNLTGFGIADNPVYNMKAFVQGSSFPLEIEYTGLVVPSVGTYAVKVYGPLDSDNLVATFNGNFDVTSANGTVLVQLPASLARGFYRVELTLSDPDGCGIQYSHKTMNVLVLGPNDIPCEVWPGDVNRDDLVNYTDRAALNRYIYDANLRSEWLNGPFRASPVDGPLATYAWMAQAALPYETPEGCHMDSDGSGNINNFDYIAIKLNWMRSVTQVPGKDVKSVLPTNSTLEQNYPNPFNPSTVLTYRTTERSRVELIVTDMVGRSVARLVDREMPAGTYTATFDAADLPGGSYFASIRVTGLESGMSYNHMVKMLLIK